MEENRVNPQTDELTLKDLILVVQGYFWEIRKFWWMLLIGAILGFCFYLYEKATTPITYGATLSFMLNDDGEGGGGGGMSLILGSLGLGGGGGKKDSSMEKILQLFKSRAVIDHALLNPATVEDSTDLLGNQLISRYGLNKILDDYNRGAWTKAVLDADPNFRFTHDTIRNFSYEEKVMLKILYEYVIGNENRNLDALLSTALDDDSGIMKVRVATQSEALTISMLNAIYENLSLFFIEKAVEKQQKTYDVLSSKNDSIINALLIAEYKLADFNDSNRALVTVKGYLKARQLERESKILNIMYAESVKNLEMAEFALKRRKPYVQLIDAPIPPIGPTIVPIMTGIIYAVLGIGAFLAFVVLRKTFKDALSS